MAEFMRVAPASALVAGGGLAFAESALDQAELKILNATLAPRGSEPWHGWSGKASLRKCGCRTDGGSSPARSGPDGKGYLGDAEGEFVPPILAFFSHRPRLRQREGRGGPPGRFA